MCYHTFKSTHLNICNAPFMDFSPGLREETGDQSAAGRHFSQPPELIIWKLHSLAHVALNKMLAKTLHTTHVCLQTCKVLRKEGNYSSGNFRNMWKVSTGNRRRYRRQLARSRALRTLRTRSTSASSWHESQWCCLLVLPPSVLFLLLFCISVLSPQAKPSKKHFWVTASHSLFLVLWFWSHYKHVAYSLYAVQYFARFKIHYGRMLL